MQAVSLVWITVLILMVLISALYFTVPGILPPMQERAKGIITDAKFIEKLQQAVDPGAMVFALFVGAALTLVWMVHSLIVWFLVLEETFKFSRLKNLGLFILTLIVYGVIMELKFTLLF
jgi:hypothetical protein